MRATHGARTLIQAREPFWTFSVGRTGFPVARRRWPNTWAPQEARSLKRSNRWGKRAISASPVQRRTNAPSVTSLPRKDARQRVCRVAWSWNLPIWHPIDGTGLRRRSQNFWQATWRKTEANRSASVRPAGIFLPEQKADSALCYPNVCLNETPQKFVTSRYQHDTGKNICPY